MKKRRKKTKKRETDSQRDAKSGSATEGNAVTGQDENPFDFGGIPSRDLKKNLGCG
jgi:hypothetical protein